MNKLLAEVCEMDGQANTVVGLILALIMGAITWATISKRERQLDDPNDSSVVYLDQLAISTILQGDGKYLLRVLRQSGNLQKDDQVFDSQDAAIKAAISTFKRAKIDYALITKNTNVEFFFRRPYHQHGGKAEGKKVGSVEIYKIE
ncbi:hypothetical protein [Thalassolituus oleivorans]|uniref:hypothetical protein n=1 Tax=Thalassolituus oleivorans TaxID=187493 RepID=UPI0030C81493